jgi:hypothetical protein
MSCHIGVPAQLRRNMAFGIFRIVSCVAVLASSAQAGISNVYMGRNDSWNQTGDGNTLTSKGSFFSADLFSDSANEYDAVQMTYPGPGSPVVLPQVSPTQFHYQTGYYANQAAMDAAFPMGNYAFAASLGGGTPDTTSFTYQNDYYPSTLPYLAGTTFSQLQGMDATKSFTFQFSPFVPGTLPTNNESNIFLTIYDQTKGMFVFNDGFLPNTTTSVVVPANTLTPGDSYSYELIFDNRATGLDSPGATFSAQISYDYRADGNFTAASVPEPTAIVLVAPVAMCLAWFATRRRAK